MLMILNVLEVIALFLIAAAGVGCAYFLWAIAEALTLKQPKHIGWENVTAAVAELNAIATLKDKGL